MTVDEPLQAHLPVRAILEDMKRTDLLDLAAKHGIKGRTLMRKAALVDAIMAVRP